MLAGVLAATLLCSFQGTGITESSGLAVSSAYDDVIYTHNDSGDVARVFQLDRTCRMRALLVLRGQDARDWEDMSRGPGNTLWLGDIGDNSAQRDRGLLVHRITDPGPTEGVVQVRWTSFRLTYEDGPKDAEALMVHPRTGQLLIVTKGFAGGGIYAAPLPLRSGDANVLRRVGEVRIPEVTSGDISPDGTRVVLRNYSSAYEWSVEGDDVVAAMRARPVEVALPSSRQGEGISYGRDGRSLLVSSEGLNAPVHEVLPNDRASAAATPSAGASPRSQPAEPRGRGVGPWLLAAALLLALGTVGLRRTRSRAAR